MILVADGWKRCCRCRQFKPHGQFGAKTRWPDGWPRTRQSYCKKCHRERERKLYGYKPRKRSTPEQQAALAALRRKKSREKLLADPKRLADERARRRMDARLQRDRKRGGPPTRVYPQRKMQDGEPVSERYISTLEIVSAAPLRAYLAGRQPADITLMIGTDIYERGLFRILKEGRAETTLDFVDRLLTLGFGRPDLLNALYPVEPR